MFSVKNDVTKGHLTLNATNDVVAFLDYTYRTNEKTLELLRMFVNFDYKHKNYTSFLLKEIFYYARKIKAKSIILNIEPEIEDCYNTIAKENGLESNYYDALIDMDEDEQEKFFERAKKLQENRKYALIHLFEKFDFTVWNKRANEVGKKKSGSNPHWFILRL